MVRDSPVAPPSGIVNMLLTTQNPSKRRTKKREPATHFVLPEILAHFRSRLDETVMAQRLQIQATDAMEKGLVSPSHLVVDTFVSEQGSQRVTDAATLYKAKKKS